MYAYVCLQVKWVSVLHVAVLCMVSAPWSLLISLPRCSHSIPSSSFSSLPNALHTRGKSKPFVFCVGPVPRSNPPPFLSSLFSLTKSLFRLDTAENHMVCVTSSGQEAGRGGMVEQGRDRLAKSLCSDVSRKALWEATGGESRAGLHFFKDFTPTWIIRG